MLMLFLYVLKLFLRRRRRGRLLKSILNGWPISLRLLGSIQILMMKNLKPMKLFVLDASGMTAPSEARHPNVVYSSCISTTTPFSSISFPCFYLPSTTLSHNIPYVLEPISFSPQSPNPNITIPSPLVSISEILSSTISPTPQPLLPPFLVSHIIQPEKPQPLTPTHSDIPIAESYIDFDTKSEVDIPTLLDRTP